MSLSELQSQWIQLYDELGGIYEDQVLAAPFIPVPEDRSKVGSDKPILLVGKATAGDWLRHRFLSMRGRPKGKRLEERRQATLGHLLWRRTEDRSPTPFWRFRRGLEQISEPVIWTNLTKIGTERLNPHWRLVERQSQLAQQTLRAEIEEYNPVLVVLVTSSFGSKEIALPLFGPEGSWKKSQDKDKSIWWQERTQARPAILWVDHPQYKPKHEIYRWLKKAKKLIR